MNFAIIIPAHNEEEFIEKMLQSVVEQTLLPKKVVVVNDASTDNTEQIIRKFEAKYPFIQYVRNPSKKHHEPGSKVVEAFYKGLEILEDDYEFIGKFDADLILPPNYFEQVINLFQSNPKLGLASGILYIKTKNGWEFENISEKTKVRGPIKMYRKTCFEEVGGLKKSIGWDTIDELLCLFHGWSTQTITSLHVKHLKPTGKVYSRESQSKQGEAFYNMRYGFILTFIASAKLAFRKKSFSFFISCLKGYWKAKRSGKKPIVSEEEGKFIRSFRWKNIRNKLSFSST